MRLFSFQHNLLTFLLILIAFLIPCKTYCQFDTREFYHFPSPNASSIIKYASTPVDLYSGTAYIMADLHSLKTRGSFSAPITISYNASGHKVQDVASSVGLGWTLSANSLITRVVRGLPDEGAGGFFNSNLTTPLSASTMNGLFDNTIDGTRDRPTCVHHYKSKTPGTLNYAAGTT